MNTANHRFSLLKRTLDSQGKVTKAVLQLCGELNIFKHGITTEQGGLGDKFIDLHFIHQQLAFETGDAGLLLAINAHLWGALFPLINFANDTQKDMLLSGLVTGKLIGGHAITESHSGSDIAAMETTATELADTYSLTGKKIYISNGPIADVLIIYAKLQGQISAFIIYADDQGADLSHVLQSQGFASASLGEVILKNCSIPKNRLLGKPGAGGQMIQSALSLERAFIFSGITGIMQRQLKHVVAHSKQRKFLRESLAQKQVIQHKLVDMQLRLETLELWLRHCAQLVDQDKRLHLASSQLKAIGGDYFLQSSQDALHIIGAMGLSSQAIYSQWLLDAMASRLISGSTEVQKHIIAAQMGLVHGR